MYRKRKLLDLKYKEEFVHSENGQGVEQDTGCSKKSKFYECIQKCICQIDLHRKN